MVGQEQAAALKIKLMEESGRWEAVWPLTVMMSCIEKVVKLRE